MAVRGSIDETRLLRITEHVLKHIMEFFPLETPTVEDVQNIVEKVMMEEGFFDVAKAYILYRYEHIK